MLLVGILLLSPLLLVAVETPGYTRGGYGSAFWRLPLDQKLDHISSHQTHWWWISIWGLVGLFTLTAGMAGLTALLDDEGEHLLALIAFGVYLASALTWMLGTILQASAISKAADQRAETSETPTWIHPLWTAGWFAEVVWIVGANLAYLVFGIALLNSELVASWAGWVAVIGGTSIPLIVGITRNGFPQLALLVPAGIGVAALLG